MFSPALALASPIGVSPPASAQAEAHHLGMLTSFPPTECGIATFSAALTGGIVAAGGTVDIVRCGRPPSRESPSVRGSLVGEGLLGRRRALEVLNATDLVIVQHEYGLYEGTDGSSIIGVLEDIVVPKIVVAHTILAAPTAGQKLVLKRVCELADVVVVMTETGRDRLIAGFGVGPSKVVVIPHGAATPTAAAEPSSTPDRTHHPRVLTWGLLGPGKGIEWAIDAMAELADLWPQPTYIIAGATHPKVLAHSGESYRQMLAHRAASSAAAPMVRFDDTYRDLPSLAALIRTADLVVLPYDSTEQVTSGVLVDAVAAGRPVVSTAFPHAVELLASGAGLVVPQRDPAALASAIRSVLTDPDLAEAMAAESRRLAPGLAWSAVAGRYLGLAGRVMADRPMARQ